MEIRKIRDKMAGAKRKKFFFDKLIASSKVTIVKLLSNYCFLSSLYMLSIINFRITQHNQGM